MERRLNSILLYGHTGVGKTITTAMALPKAVWVVTRDDNLDAYHDFLIKEPAVAEELGLEPIPSQRIFTVTKKKLDAKAGLINTDVIKEIENIAMSYCRHVASGNMPAGGLVFDEFTTFMKWAYEQLARTDNSWGKVNTIKEWASTLVEIPAATKRPVVFLGHAQDPKYDEKSGRMKSKGGPACPVSTMVGDICQMMSAVLQMEVRPKDELMGGDEVERVFLTQAHPEWERKLRLWGVAPVIPADLRALLYDSAGWSENE